jgi:hypothetical protein
MTMMVYVLSETYRASLNIPYWIHPKTNAATDMQSKTSVQQKCLEFRGEGVLFKLCDNQVIYTKCLDLGTDTTQQPFLPSLRRHVPPLSGSS